MPKFKIHLKLQALELDIEGEREDIPAITTAVQQQIAGLIRPAAALTNGNSSALIDNVIEGETDKPKQRTSRRRSGVSKTGDGSAGQALEFQHEPEKYGNPQQAWSVAEKAIWMLAVLKGIKGLKEVSGPQLAATFNHYFKQAKKVHPPNVTRDLGSAKAQTPPPVGEDKGLWYLTNAGESQAQQLIKSTLNPT